MLVLEGKEEKKKDEGFSCHAGILLSLCKLQILPCKMLYFKIHLFTSKKRNRQVFASNFAEVLINSRTLKLCVL